MNDEIANEKDADEDKTPQELGLKEIPDEEAEKLPQHDQPTEEG